MRRLRGFDYHEPDSVTDAIRVLESAGDGARVFAGGTDLVVDMKTGRMRPSAIVNLKRISGLSGIRAVPGGTWIGALTTVSAVESSPLVQDRHPALAQAASVLASPPVRALATIGGNVGRASPASDLGPALIVHQAIASIEGSLGVRETPVEAIYVGPGTTTLGSSEILTSFLLPDPSPGFGSAHVKLGKRNSGTDIALAGVSASVVVGAHGEITDCRIALASLGPTPFRATAAESLLRFQRPSEALVAAVADASSAESKPISDVRASATYRLTLARVLTVRALRAAVRSAGAEVVA